MSNIQIQSSISDDYAVVKTEEFTFYYGYEFGMDVKPAGWDADEEGYLYGFYVAKRIPGQQYGRGEIVFAMPTPAPYEEMMEGIVAGLLNWKFVAQPKNKPTGVAESFPPTEGDSK